MDFDSALSAANDAYVEDLFEDALDHYGTAILLNDQSANAYVKRAQCYLKLKRYRDALADATKAIALEPALSRAYLRKGIALFNLGDYAEAQSSFTRGLSLAKSDTSTYNEWIKSCKELIASKPAAPKANPTPAPVAQAPKAAPQTSTSTPAANPPAPKVEAPVVTPVVKPAAEVPPPQPSQPKIRHEWYQNESFVIVTVFAKNVPPQDARVTFEEQNLSVSIKLSTDNTYELDLDLCHKIAPSQCTYSVSPSKLEIKLKKASAERWATLETTEAPAAPAPTAQKNWDKILKDEPAEEEEKSEMGFLRGLYAGAGEEEKRAMMKSMQESGGTVLNMNWGDVHEKFVKPKPSEWSREQWEGKDDDSDSSDDEHWGGRKMSAEEKRRAEQTARDYHARRKQKM